MMSFFWKEHHMEMNRTERIGRLIDATIKYRPKLCKERALLYDEAWSKHRAEPEIVRRARALEHILDKMSIHILEDELIVGNQASEPKAAPLFPEVAAKWLINDLGTLTTRKYSPFYVAPADYDDMLAVLKKWDGRSVNDRILAMLPQDIRDAQKTQVILHSAMSSGIGHMVIKNWDVIQHGLELRIREIEAVRDAAAYTDPDGPERIQFCKAGLITLHAAIRFANRYADLAEEQAKNARTEKRRRELLAVAATCRRVPEKGARTFQEALQAMFFIHLILSIETNGHSISPGRLDQYIYPYYKADIERGVPREDLQEILDALWVKFNHLNKIRDLQGSKSFDGYPMFQNILVGGVTPEGKCAVNDLSYMCLRATFHTRMPQPSLSVRVSKTEDDKFLGALAEVARLGLGMPSFFNDEILIPTMRHMGYSAEEALNYAEVGCVEPTLPGTTQGFYNAGYVCFAKCLELALHNGVDPITGLDIGPHTGELEDFTTFEDVMQAYYSQFDYFSEKLTAGANIIETAHRDLTPSAFASFFNDDCLERCKTFEAGGCRYNFSAVNGVGMINAGDALAAIKKMVYDEKRMTLREMIDTLDDNEKAESIIPILRSYPPKYGNDDDYVDAIVVRLSERYFDFFEKQRNVRNGSFIAGFQSISTHISFAETVGNMPDGKRFGEVLADGGISAAQGRDKHGVTALMNSVAKIDQTRCTNGTLFNIKMNPSVVQGESGLQILVALVKSMLNMGVGHMQFNVVDKATLLDAQKHPENYSHLVVRVAGFSVYFTAIGRELQEDIIARTEHA
jgi:formate C-acetyltransferase